MSTTNNARFLRYWSEVDFSQFIANAEDAVEAKNSGGKWFPYKKGGEFRRWAGNDDYVLNWGKDGEEIKLAVVNNPTDPNTTHWSRRIFGTEYFFLESITWTKISSSIFSVRYSKSGSIFSDASNGAFPNKNPYFYLGYLNSNFVSYCLSIISPTLNSTSGDISKLPVIEGKIQAIEAQIATGAKRLVDLFQDDWDQSETSWGFLNFPILSSATVNLKSSWETWNAKCKELIDTAKLLEEQNNRLFINAYGLQDELTPEVPEDQITLARADREKDCQRLISYAIGCMMGRYSLDEPGLIYAHAGNVGFDASRYATFPADADGIVPLTDELWFEGDAASRISEFLLAVWGDGAGGSPSPQPSPQLPPKFGEGVNANMAWLAESLGAKASETPDETIRRYLADKFFKDHLQTYKKRPIYWLFSSGKQGAFQALVYLHRYSEGTLARMRAEYVVPLTGKLQARMAMLQKDLDAASSTAGRNKLTKEIDKLKKKHVELLAYDEQLRHYADMRITLDLDDGVKVNYGKFGDLLEGVKIVTGVKDEE